MSAKRTTANAAVVYLSKWSKSSDSYVTMLGALNRIAGKKGALTHPWHKLRYEDVRAIPAALTDAGLAIRTINKCLSALRGVLEAAWRSGALPDKEYRRIKIENVRGSTEAAGRALSNEEIEKFESALTRASSRDAALLTILFACGLRRVEVERLKLGDYNAETGQLRALGKGQKVRSIVVYKELRHWVTDYWLKRAATFNDPNLSAFASAHGALTRRGISYIVEQFCEDSGIAHFTPHDLRRSFGTVLLERGVPISVVQRLMGHASINTTAIYDHSGAAAEIKAVTAFGRKQ